MNDFEFIQACFFNSITIKKKTCSTKRVNTKDKYISTSMTSVFYYCVKKMCIFAFMSDEPCTTNSLITLYLLNRIRFLWIILYRKILKKTIEQLHDSIRYRYQLSRLKRIWKLENVDFLQQLQNNNRFILRQLLSKIRRLYASTHAIQ